MVPLESETIGCSWKSEEVALGDRDGRNRESAAGEGEKIQALGTALGLVDSVSMLFARWLHKSLN